MKKILTQEDLDLFIGECSLQYGVLVSYMPIESAWKIQHTEMQPVVSCSRVADEMFNVSRVRRERIFDLNLKQYVDGDWYCYVGLTKAVEDLD